MEEEEVTVDPIKQRVEQYLADKDTVDALKAAHIATQIIIGETTLEEEFPG